MSSISVIIPVWRDHEMLIPPIKLLRAFPGVRQVIVSAAEPSKHLPRNVAALGAIFVENADTFSS